MKFDTTAFKKAAKRYAGRHALPLNEAQQAFAEILGFQTIHAALKRLDQTEDLAVALPITICAASVDGAESPASSASSVFWCDLTLPRFRVLVECLLVQQDHGDPHGDLQDRSRELLQAVLSGLWNAGGGPLTTIEFFLALQLDRLGDRLKAIYTEWGHGMAAWPASQHALGRYLYSLPGYDFNRIGKRGGQSDPAQLSHGHTMAGLNRLLRLLTAIEDAGGAQACPIYEVVESNRFGVKNIVEALDLMTSSRQHPSGSLALEILKSVQVTELYATGRAA